MDYVDLYQIHRWDPNADRGDNGGAPRRREGGQGALYWRVIDVGLAIRKAQHVAARNGWTKFVSMQNHLNLLYREEEREMLPLCADQGVGVDPVEPARARTPDPAVGRGDEPFGDRRVRSHPLRHLRIRIERSSIGSGRWPRPVVCRAAQVALAWLLANPVVTAPIVGATQPHHLDDAVAAVDLELHR